MKGKSYGKQKAKSVKFFLWKCVHINSGNKTYVGLTAVFHQPNQQNTTTLYNCVLELREENKHYDIKFEIIG